MSIYPGICSDLRKLATILPWNDEALDKMAYQAEEQFPLRVPYEFLDRAMMDNDQDPLLWQILPRPDELVQQDGFSQDPLLEQEAMPLPRLIRKSPDRVLLITTEQCAIHCRYCFRRHFPRLALSLDQQQDAILSYIQGDHRIREVILSGGDPLMLPDTKLSQLISLLGDISHLKRLRIHTRVPVAWPSRVDATLLAMLADSRLPIVMVIQCNHPQELGESTQRTFREITDSGTRLLNQSVLLRKINDSEEILAQLSETLFDQGVAPYYLHLLDRVQGTHHFEVDESRAEQLVRSLRKRIPGYLVPQLIRDTPQGKIRVA